jgi:hypothetical protein
MAVLIMRAPLLRKFVVTGLGTVDRSVVSPLTGLGLYSPLLTSLTIRDALDGIEDPEAWAALMLGCPLLTKLTLENCAVFTDECLR